MKDTVFIKNLFDSALDNHKKKDLIASTTSNLQIRKSIYKHKKVKSFYINFFEKYKNKYNWLI